MNRESDFGMPSRRLNLFGFRNGMEMCCGHCRHHRKGDARYGDGWICLCDTSSYYLDETEYNFCCGEYEKRP